MTSEHPPSLADDEAKLGEYATQLGDAFAVISLAWMQRLVDLRASGMGSMPPVVARLQGGADATVAALYELLALDIAQQTIGPLEILRRAVRFPTEVLADAGVEPVARDDFATTNFPDDVYGLTPASFADVDPSLHEPGLTWGAAKAHVHLRRRREAAEAAALSENPSALTSPSPPPATSRVIALSVDLMDRSKISAAFPDAILVRSIAKLREQCAADDVVLVDLGRIDDPRDLEGIAGRVIGFGSHVDDAKLDAARAVGVDAIARSVFFRRIEANDL